MYKRLLVATDGSDLAGAAVDHGLGLAKALGAEVLLVTVTESWSAREIASDIEEGKTNAIEAFEEAAHRSALAILDRAAATASARGVTAECVHVKDRRPSEGIMETAEARDCDLIVMASHGRRGVQKLLLGSQTAEVLAASKRPVLVLR